MDNNERRYRTKTTDRTKQAYIRKQKKRNIIINLVITLFFIIIITIIVVVVLNFTKSSSEDKSKTESGRFSSSQIDEKISSSSYIPKNSNNEQDSSGKSAPANTTDKSAKKPILVNSTNKIPNDFEPDVIEIGNGYYLDRKAAKAFSKMTSGATDDGISIWPVSAYRSLERQVTVFNNKLQENKNKGMSDDEAYEETAKYVAIPGTSEHSLGLAIDINSLEESFENTKQFEWLYKNCAKYGFILRYPKDKVDITKISYEPWHYRYVGVDISTEIMANEWCLEEYMEQS